MIHRSIKPELQSHPAFDPLQALFDQAYRKPNQQVSDIKEP